MLSVFSEPNDFQAALSEGGCIDLVVSGDRKFQASLTWIRLNRMDLAAGEERQSRVAFVSIPPRSVRVTLPPAAGDSLICSGTPIQRGEIVTHSAGYRFHERTEGSCRWSTMSTLANDLATFGRTMSGTTFALPPGECRWQPAPDALRSLTGLHRDAIQATAGCPSLPVNDKAAHGLEQQLIGALIECLTVETVNNGGPSRRRQTETMVRFEDVIRASPTRALSISDIGASLGVSATTLERRCRAHLGMGAMHYLFLHRMGLVNRALRAADHAGTSVAEIAGAYGFDSHGDFPQRYRALFGEVPSATLRRCTLQGHLPGD